jgi:heme-degrading monooxygenase HmoA
MRRKENAPMPVLLVRHKVQDYARWKSVFDEDDTNRRAGGSQGGRVLRSASDPNELVLLLEWDDLAKARQFASSYKLREAMQRAGVADQPDIYFLEELEAVPV